MDSHEDLSEKKTVYNLYALFGVALFLCFLPYVSAAIICLIFFTLALVFGYRVRGSAEEHSLAHNHAVYLIRSLWIGGLFSLIGIVLASVYMLQNMDYGAFSSCTDTIFDMDVEAIEALGFADFYAIAEPCIDGFVEGNYRVLMISVILAGGLPLVYLGYRFIKGASRAIKGYRLANPKAWF